MRPICRRPTRLIRSLDAGRNTRTGRNSMPQSSAPPRSSYTPSRAATNAGRHARPNASPGAKQRAGARNADVAPEAAPLVLARFEDMVALAAKDVICQIKAALGARCQAGQL